MNIWLVLIPAFPVAAAAGALTLGQRMTRGGGWLVVSGLALSAMGIAILTGSGILQGQTMQVNAGWMGNGELDMTIGLYLDGLSFWVAAVVALICLMVTIYSVASMREEAGLHYFFALLGLFGGSMLALVLSGSFILLFMAWEAVGFCSFGLIAFRYEEVEVRRSAAKAFLMTRLGDTGLLLGWLLLLILTGTTHIPSILDQTGGLSPSTLTLLALLFIVAAAGKSAQLPLTAWLPDAMVGPTPVSALLHSATMVAAGVYLLLRIFPLIEVAPAALTVLLWTGAITALLAALIATTRFDLKRILAWSTVSQLGEMIMALGLAGPIAAAFHLTTHAVFKSSLFLCAGAIDHSAGNRDIRKLSGLWKSLPLTAAVFSVSALALAGFPPFAGFWSEEKILGAAQAHGAGWGYLMLGLIFLAGMYIARAGWAVFGARRRPFELTAETSIPKDKRPPRLVAGPMVILGVSAVVLGYAIKSPVEQLLPFAAESHTLGLWRWGAVGFSALGLAAGAWRVRAAGPVPALGAFPDAIARVVHAVPSLSARAVLLTSRGTQYTEGGLDRLARVAAINRYATAGLQYMERCLDRLAHKTASGVQVLAGGVDRSEVGFGAAGDAASEAAVHSAGVTEKTERIGFGDGLDQSAYALRQAGQRLGMLQNGKVFHYTFGLFLWVLGAGIIGLLLWM